MRKPLVIGNWKMHGNKAANSQLLAAIKTALAGISSIDSAVCVPFPYLFQVSELVSGSSLAWGAQTVSEYAQGAYTGEVSAAMLKDFGCRYVLVGHSERRTIYGETDAQVAAKFEAAESSGLIPVLCIGETLAEREAGETEKVVTRQLNVVLDKVGADAFSRAVIAYEPVWAIGTGLTASPEQAQQVHAAIRVCIAERNVGIASNLQILYGGSVKPQNAVELFAQADIDGGLIGGAALVAGEFLAICRAAGSVTK